MERIRGDGNGAVIAPRWAIVGVPVAAAIVGAIIGIMTMLLMVVTKAEVSHAADQHQQITAERWRVHGMLHDDENARIKRLEDKIDRLIERRP